MIGWQSRAESFSIMVKSLINLVNVVDGPSNMKSEYQQLDLAITEVIADLKNKAIAEKYGGRWISVDYQERIGGESDTV